MLDIESLAGMLAPIIAEEVSKAVSPLNAKIAELEAREPVAGPPGEKGDAGSPGEPGRDGANGQDGSDGRGVKDLLIDRDGNLVATMDDGSTKSLGPVMGKDGSNGNDGQPGRDGFSLDDFDVERGNDGRTFVLKFDRGDTRHEYELTFPVPVYCGVFKEAAEYVPGDMVTWAGSLWHCDKATTDRPGTDSWTLAVKKGRDGKDAKVG